MTQTKSKVMGFPSDPKKAMEIPLISTKTAKLKYNGQVIFDEIINLSMQSQNTMYVLLQDAKLRPLLDKENTKKFNTQERLDSLIQITDAIIAKKLLVIDTDSARHLQFIEMLLAPASQWTSEADRDWFISTFPDQDADVLEEILTYGCKFFRPDTKN
jgi:hypothetical protein